MEVSYQHSSKYLLFSSAQESESYRFGKTYGKLCQNFRFLVDLAFSETGQLRFK